MRQRKRPRSASKSADRLHQSESPFRIVAAAFRGVFDRLFWSWRGERFKIDDVGGREMDGIETAWSPATVARFAAVARAVDLDAGRAAFRPGDQHRFEEAGEFVAYGEAWLRIVQDGAAGGRGLVVIAFG